MNDKTEKVSNEPVYIKIGSKDVYAPQGCLKSEETYKVSAALGRHFIDRKQASKTSKPAKSED